MKFLNTAVTVAGLAMLGTAASAATYDFATDADDFFDSSGYEGTFAQVYSGADAVAAGTAGNNTNGGVTVKADAFRHLDDSEAHPFMDSDVAGLGVCSSGFVGAGSISNCSTGHGSETGDDNLMFPEVLALHFSDSVRLGEMFIRDAVHNPLDGLIAIMTDFHVVQLFDVVAGVVQGSGGAGFSDTFYITSGTLWCGDDVVQLNSLDGRADCSHEELYVSTLTASVPVPAAGFLLLGGLGGLMAFRRRKS